MKDKISIIVPCYNVEKYLCNCLKSIENQTYGFENFEIILINDASPDNVGGILDAFRQKHTENTIIINNKVNRGLSYSRNIGMEFATGKYIMFVDSDDALCITAIEHMHDKAVEYGCDVVAGRHEFCDDVTKVQISVGENNRFIDMSNPDARKEAIISTNQCYVWGKLYLREAIERYKIRFPEGKVYEDIPFTLQCLVFMNSYYYLDETVYCYYSNDDSITRGMFHSEKVRCFSDNIDWAIEEIKKRDTDGTIWNTFRYEIESFALWLGYMQPVRLLMGEIRWYKEKMLERAPEIRSSNYFTNIIDPLCKKYIDFLSDDMV